MTHRCRYPKCGKPDEAAHSEGCKSHPKIHATIVAEAIQKKVEPAYCCPAHRKRHLENGYRERRRERIASDASALAKAPIARRVAALAADSIDPDLAAWKRSDQ